MIVGQGPIALAVGADGSGLFQGSKLALANANVKYFWRVKAMADLPDPASVKF